MRSSAWIQSGVAILLAAVSCSAATDFSLIDAIKRRDTKTADALVAKRANIDAALPDGATALSWAVFLDLEDTAVKLMEAGADVNARGDYGETPLTLALANGNVALTARLLKAGADPKATRWNGETALMIAAGAGSVDEVKLLLDAGLDVNAAESEKGQNALMWAAAEGHPDVVDLLIQKGANVNAATKSGFTALAFATMKNNSASVRLLAKAGADPNNALPDKDKTKMLLLAAAYDSTQAAMALLDGGANPNVADRRGRTPLHIAAQAGSLELVRKLVSKGADLNARTAKINTPDTGFFRAPAGEQTPLLLAAKFNQVDVMRVLIEAGADTKLKAQDGTTLFLAAAGSGHVEVAKYAYEFDKDVKAVDSLGFTAMHESVSGTGRLATQPELTELVQYLADIGVPLDEVDSRGRTPIQVGDGAPLDQPIQRMADIIISRGGKPRYFPKEYVKPASAAVSR
jgi:ankyrin repeat protein